MAIRTLKENNLVWINIDTLDDKAIAYLKENFHFHQLDYEDLQGEVKIPKIDVYNNYLFLVFHFPHWNALDKRIKSNEVDVFIGENYIITVQCNRTKEMKNFFYRCMKNRKVKNDWMQHSSGYVLYRLIEALFHESQPILDKLGEQIYNLENRIYAGEQHARTVTDLAGHRRNVLKLRRILDPQKYLIANLSHIRKPFLDESLSLYFDNVNDYLSKLWSISDTYRDLIEGLHVTLESLMNRRTTKIISTLTIISVSLMPLTLLSGIYGMNIKGLPFADRPMFVWLMFAGLAAFIMIFILTMKKRKRI